MPVFEKGLIVKGWIHTHPTETAFLRSIDVHTQFSYQALLQEAVAVVCAPTYQHVKWLRLTKESMAMIKECLLRGFHEHVGKSRLYQPVMTWKKSEKKSICRYNIL